MKKIITCLTSVIGNPFDGMKIFTLWSCLLLVIINGFAQAPNTWTQKADFGGTERYGAVGFSIGIKAYIGTGFRGGTGGGVCKDFWEYDSNTDTWAQKADFGGIPRSTAVGFSIGTKGYIGTGGDNFGNVNKDFWEYDPLANIWTQKADFGGTARYAAVGFSIGNKGYIGTGYDGPPAYNYTAKKDFWEYDPDSDTWTQKSDFQGVERQYAVGFAIGSKGYIGTGLRVDIGPSKDFWEYNPSSDTWTQKADFGGSARFVSSGFSIGTKGYIGIGHTTGHVQDFWEYDSNSDIWTPISDFGGSARSQAVGFTIGSKGFIGTGYGDSFAQGSKDFWVYTPLLNQITTNVIAGSPFCVGTNVNIDFNAIGVANSGNTFTAQLSDASGSFASPINIGSLSSTNSGSISSEIPLNTVSGNGYRIRIVSSDPIIIGSDNGSDFMINALPTITASASPNTICQGGSSILTVLGATSYSWSPSESLSSSTGSSVTATPTVTTTYTVTGTQSDGWTQKADFGGIGKWSAAGFSIGTKGYIGTGGVIASDYRNDFWEYDSNADTWAQKANYPGAGRVGSVGFSIGGKGYMGAGFLPGFNVQSDFWEYDPSINTWTQKTDLPSARAGFIGFSIGTKAYIGLGTEAGFIVKKDFWEYNPNADTWIQKADFGGGIKSAGVAFSIGSKGYVGTGIDGAGFTKDFWEYNPSTDVWTQKANFGGTERYTASGFSLGTKGYIGLGYDGSIKNDIWEYNPDTDNWTQKNDFPVPKHQAVAFSIGNKAYVGTGHATDDSGEKDFWEYNPSGCSNTTTVTVTVPILEADWTSNNSILYYASSCARTAVVPIKVTGVIPPYTVTSTMNRSLKCNIIANSGDELWIPGAGTISALNVNTVCPSSGGGLIPSSTGNVNASGGSYSVAVTLMANATITFTVTDANGCVATCSKNIEAEDVRCFAGNSGNAKVTICHRIGSTKNPCVKICVDPSAVEEHLGHGDFVGSCNPGCVAPINAKLASSFNVKAYPNPTQNQFTIVVEGNNNEKINVFVYDLLGRMVKQIVNHE